MPPREAGGQSLREQVAEAIHYAREARDPTGYDPDAGPGDGEGGITGQHYVTLWEDLGEGDQRDLLEQADAAVAAYREHEQGEGWRVHETLPGRVRSSREEGRVQVRFCPDGAPTFDEWRTFPWRLPTRGEAIYKDGSPYVVVDVDWYEDGPVMLICHAASRPRARAARDA